MLRVPELITVRPLYVFAPERVTEPAAFFVKVPVPRRFAEIAAVPVVLLVVTEVAVNEPFEIVSPLVGVAVIVVAPTVWLPVPRSRFPPPSANVPVAAPSVPVPVIFSVPALMFVPPV